jgi:hypothetical protein
MTVMCSTGPTTSYGYELEIDGNGLVFDIREKTAA